MARASDALPALIAAAIAGDPAVLADPAPTATVDRREMNIWMLRTLGAFSRFAGAVGDAGAPRAPPVARSARFISVIYVIGLEGVGHHGLTPALIYALVRKYGFGDVYVWWRGLRDVFLPESVRHEGRPLYRSPCDDGESMDERLARRRAAVAALLAPLKSRGRPCAIFEFASFPWGTDEGRTGAGTRFAGATVDRDEPHPGDSVSLDDWHAVFADDPAVDARYLVLRRDPVAAAWSHRGWDGSFARHGATLAALDAYVADVLRDRRLCAACAASFAAPLCRDCAAGHAPFSWRWVAYEDLCRAAAADGDDDDEGRLAAALAAFCRVDARDVADALAHFVPSTKVPACDAAAAAAVAAAAVAAAPAAFYGWDTHVLAPPP